MPEAESERIFVTHTRTHRDGLQKVKYHKIVQSFGSEGDNTVGNIDHNMDLEEKEDLEIASYWCSVFS